MADQLKFRGGTTAQVNAASVASREIIIDTSTDQIVSGPSKKKTVMQDASGDVQIGAGNITLNSDGTASFTSGSVSIDSTGNITITDKIIHNGDTNTAIRFPTNDTVSIETAGTEHLRIDSSGNVGIGTASPTAKLYVNGNATFAGDSTNGSGQITLNCENNSHGIKIKGPPHSAGANYTLTLPNDTGTNGYVLKTDGSGITSWVSVSSGSTDSISEGNTIAEVIDTGGDGRFIVTTEGSERLRIDSTGKVGIGTNSPSTKLHVDGTVTATAFSGSGANLTGLPAASAIPVADESSNTTCFPIFTTAATGSLELKSGSNLNFNSSSGALTATSFVGDGSNLTSLPAANTITVADESSDSNCFPIFTTAATGSLELKSGSNLYFNSSSGALTATSFVGDGSNLTSLPAATTIPVADESSDTTCFPIFTTSATGNLPPKSGTNLTFNSSNGTLTATKFSGDGSNLTSLPAANTITVADESSDSNCFPIFTTSATGSLELKSGSNLYFNSSSGALTATSFVGDGSNLTSLPAATTIPVADESSDTTCFPIFTTAATGNLPPKSGTNLTFNSSSGTLTATSFVGDGSALTNLPSSSSFSTDIAVNDLTVGRGAGSVSSNSTFGYQALNSNTTGSQNVAVGEKALYDNTTGGGNTAVGRRTLYENTTGSTNVAIGQQALSSNTTGDNNVANGSLALYSNTTGDDNVATGRSALRSNTTGSNNVANGYYALYENTTGSNNVANGYYALHENTTGANNTANGSYALHENTTGVNNTANGYEALKSNTTGENNTASGLFALQANTTGSWNVAIGREALKANTTSSFGVAVGIKALNSNTTGTANVAIGREALKANISGSGNIGIGFMNSSGSYAPVFNPSTEDNRLVLGHTSITQAYVQVAWTVTSDARDKMNFAPVPYGLDFVNQLKPTAYQFKVDRDTETPNGDVRYGFKAQDILALEGDNPVIIDTEDADNLKYKGEHLVPVLVNAVQELTAMVNYLLAKQN